MGSSCSILNDTKHDVWITHRVNWEVVVWVTVGLLAVTVVGGVVAAAVLAQDDTDASEGKNKGRSVSTSKGTTSLDQAGSIIEALAQTCFRNKDSVLDATNTALAKLLEISEEQAEKMKRAIQELKGKVERISPGKKYTWYGTLSLTMRVYVMNDKLQCDDRGCFTGSTDGSENVYTISEYFKKLDVD